MSLLDVATAMADYIAGRPSRARLNARLARDGYEIQASEIEELLSLARSVKRQPQDEPAAPAQSEEPAPPRASGRRVETRQDEGDLVLDGTQIRTLDELLEAAHVDLKEWRVAKWISNTWAENWQVKAWLERRLSAEVQPTRGVMPLPRRPASPTPGGRTALIVPDSQNGYSRDFKSGKLTPMHDRVCWDLVVQAAQHLQPDNIAILGDMADLAAWGAYRVEPQHRFTMQPTVDELHWWLAALRQAAPSAEITYFAGNHENRIDRALTDRIDEAVGVCPVGSSTPALSLASLLRLDLLDIEYVPDYGDARWLWGKIRIEHGQTHGRSAMDGMLNRSLAPSIMGHTHHRELIWRTIETPDGPLDNWAFSPGCICHTDGRVPGVRKGQQNWQQGFGVVREIGDVVLPEPVPISRGRAVVGGAVLVGQDRTPEIATATGWSM